MRRFSLLAVALWLVLASMSVAATPDTAAPDAAIEPATIEPEVLRRIVEEEGVVPIAESPGVSLYFRDLGLAFLSWLGGWISRFLPELAGAGSAVGQLAAPVVFGVALGVLLLVFLRFWRHRRRRRSRATASPAEPATGGSELAASPVRSPEEWEEELRRHLEAGDPTVAAEALWWWLAVSLAGATVEASWTSRELVAHAGRSDLRLDVDRLDRLLYGVAAATVADVERLWSALRLALSPVEPAAESAA